ncbi:hypothetical protein Prudu_009677, partial [Prunus dulcis]
TLYIQRSKTHPNSQRPIRPLDLIDREREGVGIDGEFGGVSVGRAIAGEFGEGMMHPVDPVKARIQSRAILCESQMVVHTLTRDVTY